MKITVEIEDSKIKAIQKWTNQRKKSPAIAFEITKDDGESFFKKTINTSKGAIILIEPETS